MIPAGTATPTTTPMTPPSSDSVVASVRNCRTMSRRKAPTALRTPISRVRSVTETSMMFITPTPPIRSEMKAMKIIAPVMPSVMPWKLSIILSGVRM